MGVIRFQVRTDYPWTTVSPLTICQFRTWKRWKTWQMPRLCAQQVLRWLGSGDGRSHRRSHGVRKKECVLWRVFSRNDFVGNLDYFSAANEWVTKQKLDDFEKLYKAYITRTSQAIDSRRASQDWIAADTILSLTRRNSEHTKYVFLLQICFMTDIRSSFRVCNKMLVEVCRQRNSN